MTIISASAVAIIAFLSGILFQNSRAFRQRLRCTKARLTESGAQIAKTRLQLASAGRAHNPNGLIAWARQHAAQLLDQNEGTRLAALGLADKDRDGLGHAEDMEREVWHGICAARSIMECTERYLSKQICLDNQKMNGFLDDIEGLRRRLGARLDRSTAGPSIYEEQIRLVRLGARIVAERETFKSDPAVGWNRIQSLLRALVDVDQSLESKLGAFNLNDR
ncbi:MAG: hypothetical protein WCT10_03090 [Patescibacteria group bacterium]|jgi:hypothetical protein